MDKTISQTVQVRMAWCGFGSLRLQETTVSRGRSLTPSSFPLQNTLNTLEKDCKTIATAIDAKLAKDRLTSAASHQRPQCPMYLSLNHKSQPLSIPPFPPVSSHLFRRKLSQARAQNRRVRMRGAMLFWAGLMVPLAILLSLVLRLVSPQMLEDVSILLGWKKKRKGDNLRV